MNLLVAGSREGFPAETVIRFLSDLYHQEKPDLLIHGACRGVDKAAGRWAEGAGVPVKEMPADWDKHGRAAGPIRSWAMVKQCDAAVVFWRGDSPGTRNTISFLEEEGKPYILYRAPEGVD